MSVIIDANALSAAFNSKNEDHPRFKIIIQYLKDKNTKVKLVYGGTKYLKEVGNFRKYGTFLIELEKIRKLRKIPCALVDAKYTEIEQMLIAKGRSATDERYNDGHIMALAITSGTKIIVTCDRQSMPFLRERCFYDHPNHIPRFYTSARNEGMLSDPAYF